MISKAIFLSVSILVLLLASNLYEVSLTAAEAAPRPNQEFDSPHGEIVLVPQSDGYEGAGVALRT